MPIRPLSVIALLAVLLAGCAGTPPPEPDPAAARGTLYDLGEGAPEPIAIGLVLLTPEFLTSGVSPSDLAGATLIEPAPGVWMGAFGAPDMGAFEVVLPDEDDLPEAALVPLAEAVVNFGACTVEAAPVAARATLTVFDGVTFPGLAALTALGSGVMFASDAEVDLNLPLDGQGVSFHGWIFVDRAATLTTSGCGYVADLALGEGWNQLAWSLEEPSVIVSVVPETDVVAALVDPFPPFGVAGVEP